MPSEPLEPGSKEAMTHAVEVAETDILLSKALCDEHKAMEGCQDGFEQEDVIPDPELASDEEDAPPTKKSKVDMGEVKTLGDVLAFSQLEGFQPSDVDNEAKLFQRMKSLSPYMSSFCAFVRCSEKILSKASVLGHVRMKSRHQIVEHELAEARQEFHCCASRQNRFSLWADYSSRVAEVVEASPEDEGLHDGVVALKTVSPGASVDDDGNRLVQLVLCRPFAAGGEKGPLRLGMVTAVWRGGKGKKLHVWPEGPLQINAARKVHVRLLLPQKEKDEDGRELCVCSSLSPIMVLDVHDGGLLVQVPHSQFVTEFHDDCMKVWISRKSVKAFFKIDKAQVPFEPKVAESVQAVTYYTEDDFGRTVAGARNVVRFLEKMKRDYEGMFSPLEDDAGFLKLRQDIKVSWTELVARANSYFKRYMKGHDHYKSLSPADQGKSFL